MRWTRTLGDLPQTEALGEALGARLPGGSFIALTGDLGAGKTTLTQAIARGLGIPPRVRVQSPTYTLLRSYDQGRIPLHHLDLYRLGDADELVELGFEQLIDGEGLTVVEWADRFPEVLPEEALHLTLTWEGPEVRGLVLEVRGAGAPVVAVLHACLGPADGEAP